MNNSMQAGAGSSKNLRRRRPPRAQSAASGADMTDDEKNRLANFKLQRHKTFYRIQADDSDVTDIESDEEEEGERLRLEARTRRDHEELGMANDDDVKLFYEATASIRKLASIIDTQKRSRLSGLDKVVARTSVMATTGSSILTSMRAKRYREEIYRGSGVSSVMGKPYVSFEVGIGFEQSAKECDQQLKEIFASRHEFKNPEPVERPGTIKMVEIGFTGHVYAAAKRYERKVFFLDLAKLPKAQVRGKSISVTLESTEGDPDLYMAIAEPPTEKEYTWRSVREGSDLILIHPHDPNYIYGTYYIGVSCPASDSSFKLFARMVDTESSDDDKLFARTQLTTYQTLRETLHESNNRRRLCAGGKSFQRVLLRDAQALGVVTEDLTDAACQRAEEMSLTDEPGEGASRDASASELSGLQWEEVSWRQTKMGTSVNNAQLAAALLHKTAFSLEEYEEWRVPRLAFDSYVKAGSRYFRPVGAGRRQEYLRRRGVDSVALASSSSLSAVHKTEAVAREEARRPRPLAETLDAQVVLSVHEKMHVLPGGARREEADDQAEIFCEEKSRFESERGDRVRDGARSNPAF